MCALDFGLFQRAAGIGVAGRILILLGLLRMRRRSADADLSRWLGWIAALAAVTLVVAIRDYYIVLNTRWDQFMIGTSRLVDTLSGLAFLTAMLSFCERNRMVAASREFRRVGGIYVLAFVPTQAYLSTANILRSLHEKSFWAQGDHIPLLLVVLVGPIQLYGLIRFIRIHRVILTFIQISSVVDGSGRGAVYTDPRPRPRANRFRFGLDSLLIVMLLCALMVEWWSQPAPIRTTTSRWSGGYPAHGLWLASNQYGQPLVCILQRSGSNQLGEIHQSHNGYAVRHARGRIRVTRDPQLFIFDQNGELERIPYSAAQLNEYLRHSSQLELMFAKDPDKLWRELVGE
jgi:hypothetical protein